jgi:hypothetical protein
MARLAAECTAQWIQVVVAWALVLELAWFVIDFCGMSTLRKLCAICANSVDRSSALMYNDAS